MRKGWSVTRIPGFSLVEAALASAVFGLLVTALVGAYLYGQESTALAGNRVRAVLLAEEGLEAVRNIRDAGFSNLSDGTFGLTTAGNQWNLSGSQDVSGMFTRQIAVSSVDAARKSVTATVTWQQNLQRSGIVSLGTRMTAWQASAPAASCNDHAIEQGFSFGTCRSNAVLCAQNAEIYLPTGDPFCTGGPSADTCCALP